MKVRVDTDALGAAAQQFSVAAADVENALTLLGPGEVAWLAARAARPMVVVNPAGDSTCVPSTAWACAGSTWGARLALAREVEEQVTALLVQGTVEQRRLQLLALGLRSAARLWAEVEESVGAAIRRLDETAYRHPDVVERWADRGNRWVLGPLISVGDRVGVFNECDSDVVALRTHGTRAAAPPTSLSDLIAADVEVTDSDGLVRVTEVVRADGSSAWIVAISGTQEWSPFAGDNPFDLTTDVQTVAQRATLAAVGVHLALLHAQRSSGRDTSAEPILVTGHSLGGLLAATVAADPAFRAGRNIVGVVAAASPIAQVPVPESMPVIALEHHGDVVPLLDGRPNPNRPGWHTTIVDPGPVVTQGRASKAHAGDLYRQSAEAIEGTAPPRATEPAESAQSGAGPASSRELPAPSWQSVLDPFVSGAGRTAVVHEFTLTREWQNPRT